MVKFNTGVSMLAKYHPTITAMFLAGNQLYDS